MNCCDDLMKDILIVFNLLFGIPGLALIILGAYAKIHADNYLNFLGDQYVNIPIFVVCVGGVIFVIAFLGCLGAKRRSPCMLNTFAAYLVIIILAEIGAGVAVYFLKGALKEEVTKNIKDGMKNFDKFGYEGVTKTWNLMQEDVKCCGVAGPEDWKIVPDSCCVDSDLKGCASGENIEIYHKGCLQEFEDQFLSNIDIVAAIAIGICVFQIFGIFFACVVMKKDKKPEERGGIESHSLVQAMHDPSTMM